MKRGSSAVECRIRNQLSPGSNSHLLPFRRLDIFIFYIDVPVGVIAASLECFPEKLIRCRNEQVCQGATRVKRFQRSNELDTALYKKTTFTFFFKVGKLVVEKTKVSSCSVNEYPSLFLRNWTEAD